MRRLCALLLGVTLALTVLGGCGGKKKSTAETKGPEKAGQAKAYEAMMKGAGAKSAPGKTG